MSLGEHDMLKIEKEKAMLRYQRFNNIANIARFLEFCFALVFFSWSIARSSAYFPAIVGLCGFLMRWLCALVVSQHFIFLLGNLIIITLFVKSDRSAADDEDSLIRGFLPHQETVSCVISEEEEVFVHLASEIEDRAVQRKEPAARRSRRTRSEEFKVEVTDKIQLRRSETEPRRKMNCSEEESTARRRIKEPAARRSRRTRSEDFEVEVTDKIQLRRSETEPRRKMNCSEEESTARTRMTVEDLSNEEFQREVEAFIERQQRFLREESLPMVMRNPSSA